MSVRSESKINLGLIHEEMNSLRIRGQQCKSFAFYTWVNTGIILWMHPANKRWCYIVTSCLISWANTQNDPCWYCRARIIERTINCSMAVSYWPDFSQIEILPLNKKSICDTPSEVVEKMCKNERDPVIFVEDTEQTQTNRRMDGQTDRQTIHFSTNKCFISYYGKQNQDEMYFFISMIIVLTMTNHLTKDGWRKRNEEYFFCHNWSVFQNIF